MDDLGEPNLGNRVYIYISISMRVFVIPYLRDLTAFAIVVYLHLARHNGIVRSGCRLGMQHHRALSCYPYLVAHSSSFYRPTKYP